MSDLPPSYLRFPRLGRLTLTGLYGCLGAAGIMSIILAPGALAGFGLLYYVWAGFIVLGGIGGVYGSLREQWYPAFLTLPLQISALCVYALSLLAEAAESPRRIIISLILFSIAFGLTNRWLHLFSLVRDIRKSQEEQGD